MADDKPQVTIYTDGGADPNPGPGGWGVVLIHNKSGKEKDLSGSDPETTNNRMELTAAIRALQALKTPCDVKLFTDSEYLRRGVTEWMEKWEASNWSRGKQGEVKNIDLWKQLASEIGRHDIHWEWVKGHAGNRYNERADQLATAAIRAHYAELEVDEPDFEGVEVIEILVNVGDQVDTEELLAMVS